MHGSACSVDGVLVDDSLLLIRFGDGRVLAVPRGWFPSLMAANLEDLKNYTLSPFGIHWPSLDEDISVDGLLSGRGAQGIGADVTPSLARVRRIMRQS